MCHSFQKTKMKRCWCFKMAVFINQKFKMLSSYELGRIEAIEDFKKKYSKYIFQGDALFLVFSFTHKLDV